MANTSLQSLSYLGANLMLGRSPQLEAAPLDSTFPAPAAGGVDVTGAALALVKVSMREHPAYRTAYYVVTATDLTATYTASINGNDVVYDASAESPANLAELCAGWAAAINADGTVGAIVLATAADYAGDGVINAVRVIGNSADDYSVDVGYTGSAHVTLYADASGATMTLFARPDVSPSSLIVAGAARQRALGWAAKPLPDGSLSRSLGANGWCDESVLVAGLAALDVQLSSVVGDPSDGTVTYTPQAIVCPKRQESSQ